MRFGRRSALAAGALSAMLLLGACSNNDSSTEESASSTDEKTLTLYNAQHEDMMQELIDGFTKDTGIKVETRKGSDSEMANQIVTEGSASPADVFVTENSPAMVIVDGKSGFSKIDAATLAQVPTSYAPSDGNWVGFAGRSTVLAYNTKLLSVNDISPTIMDLAQPKWKDKIGFSPSGADFQAIVSAVLAVKGEAATAEWLKGLKANAKIYQGNNRVLKAVNDGEIQAGVIYHYYWYKDRAESGANSANTELYFYKDKDPGAFVSVSGAGVIKASKKQALAQQFVKYITSPAGQQILAQSKALEYPIGNGAVANAQLKPLSELDPPAIDISTLNGPQVIDMMRTAGLL